MLPTLAKRRPCRLPCRQPASPSSLSASAASPGSLPGQGSGLALAVRNGSARFCLWFQVEGSSGWSPPHVATGGPQRPLGGEGLAAATPLLPARLRAIGL